MSKVRIICERPHGEKDAMLHFRHVRRSNQSGVLLTCNSEAFMPDVNISCDAYVFDK